MKSFIPVQTFPAAFKRKTHTSVMPTANLQGHVELKPRGAFQQMCRHIQKSNSDERGDVNPPPINCIWQRLNVSQVCKVESPA